MTTKRTIIIVLIIVVIGIAAYILLRGGTSSTKTQTGTTGSLPGVATGTVPIPSFFSSGGTSAVGSVSAVGTGPVAAYFVGSSSAIEVVQTDGEIDSLMGGQTMGLSSSSIPNLGAASFSYNGGKAVVSSGNAGNPQTSVFDVATQSWTSLGGGIMSAAWAPQSARLAYLRDNGNGTESIVLTDYSKTKPTATTLGTVSAEDMELTWADANDLALVSRPSAYADGSALAFNVKTRTLTPIVIDRLGLEATWAANATSSPVGGLVFFTDQSERGGKLQFVDLQGNVLQNLSLLTLPTKCTFAVLAPATTSVATPTVISTGTAQAATSSATSNIQYSTTALFCAVPRDQTTLGYYDLPDAYEQRQIFTTDDLYEVNIINGHIDAIFNDQTQNFDMSNVGIVGSSLFFVNRYDQKLYAIRIQ